DFVLVPELWGPTAKAIFENRTRAILKGYPGRLFSAALTPAGWRILTGTQDGREDERIARVWDPENECAVAILKGQSKRALHCASFSPDGRRIVTASLGGTVRVWDAASGQQIAIGHEHRSEVWRVSYGRDVQYTTAGREE